MQSTSEKLTTFIVIALFIITMFEMISGGEILGEIIWVHILGNSTVKLAPDWVRGVAMISPIVMIFLIVLLTKPKKDGGD